MDDKIIKSGANPKTHSRNSSLLEIIFGSQVRDVINETNEIPEAILSKAIDLKIEQEKTKQQYYKLANIDKCLELIKASKSYGIPPQHLIHFVNNDRSLDSSISKDDNKPINAVVSNSNSIPTTTTSTFDTNITPVASTLKSPSPYKFPPVNPLKSNGSKNSNKIGINSTERRTSFHRRTQSPARIGANAVAALSNSIPIKEEETSEFESPLKNKRNLPIGNSANGNTTTHNRNFSLPTMNKFVNSNIPTNMVSILNFDSNKESSVLTKNNVNSNTNNNIQFDKTNNNVDNPSAYSNINLTLEASNDCYLKRPVPVRSSSANSVQKKIHRRTKSATVIPTFGVIDLNVIDHASLRNKSPVLSGNNINKISGDTTLSPTNNDTCSESSSTKGVESPVKVPLYPQQQQQQYEVPHPHSLNRLLNDY